MKLPSRIVVVADVSNNMVDGSVVWLKNLMLALTSDETAGQTILLLREDRQPDSFLFPPDLTFPNCELLTPAHFIGSDTGAQAVLEAEQLPRLLALLELRFGRVDSILVRGHKFAAVLLDAERYRDRVCVYTTERPAFASTVASEFDLKLIAHSKHILVQSEAQKRYFEVYLQAPSRKVTIFPPMVAVHDFGGMDIRALAGAKAPILSYAGKLDSQYCVEQLVDLAPALAATGWSTELIGNKINRASNDPGFVDRLRSRLGATDGLTWLQGATHELTQRRMRAARFGFCVRSPAMDNSIELSTKLLEYCSQATPPILRRTPQHVALFGDDYPYFATSPEDVARVLATHPVIDDRYVEMLERILDIARRFDIAKAVERLAPVRTSSQSGAAIGTSNRIKVMVATHDDKFIAAALRRLAATPDIEIRFDRWSGSRKRYAVMDAAEARWPEVVFCEWCCEQAVWWSENKIPGQKLIVRLHRFEAFEDFPVRMNWSAVDHLIVVSQYFKDLAIREFGVRENTIHVLPQYVDTADFDRPKLARADFTVGLIGINAFSHKRPDRAIEFIDKLRRKDPRFRLRVRSRLPWEYKWVWQDRPAERVAFVQMFRGCLIPPLSHHVQFDRAGSDMAEWCRSVSFILSSSDTEGCHTSVAEGMASGCYPVCYAWPGAESVYGAGYVHHSVDEMVNATLAAAAHVHSARGRTAMKVDAARFDIQVTVNLLQELIR